MDFKLPDLGEGIHEGQILTVHVVEGQSINEDELLMEVETDKAAVEIPSPCTGTIVKVHVQDKQLVHVGDVMVTFDSGENAQATPSQEVVADTKEVVEPLTQKKRVDQPKVRTSPSNRKLARTLGVDLHSLQGTGSGGRITRQDIEQAVQEPEQSIAKVEPVPRSSIKIEQSIDGVQEQDEYGAIIRQPMSQARKSISKAMCLAWETVPHVTDCNDVDITAIDELRKTFHDPDQPNLKLTLLPFVIKAVCRALKKYPILNAAIDSDTGDVLFRQYVNIAIGVDSERGLIAPVIRNADLLSVGEISTQLEQIIENARSASFSIADTRGATYTISNAGAVGRTRYSTPIIQQGTVACLAVGRARKMPWVVDDKIVPRLILPLSHSIDHRLIDGGREIPFIEHLMNDLEHPMRFVV